MSRFQSFLLNIYVFILLALPAISFSQTTLDSTQIAQIYSYADTLAKHSKFDSALTYYNISKNYFERTAHWDKYFQASVKIIQINDVKGNYQIALAVFDHLDSIAAETVGSNSPIVASAYIYAGIVYYRLAEYDKAISHYKKSMEIQKQLLEPDYDKIIACYNNIGLLYQRKQDYGRALQYFLQSLNLMQEKSPGVYKNLGRLYNNISITYYYQLDYDKSLEYAKKSLDFKKSLYHEMNPQIGISYSNIALIYAKKKEYEKALEYQKKALKIYKATLDPNHPNIAKTLTNIANVYYKAGIDTNLAFQYNQQAIEINRKRLGEHHPDLADEYRMIGNMYSESHHYNQALQAYHKAFQVLVPGFADTSLTSNPPITGCTSKAILLYVLQDKADVLQKMGIVKNQNIPLLKSSLTTSQLAIQLMDQMNLNYEAESSKLLLTELSYQIFGTGIQTSMLLSKVTGDDHYYQTAFYIAEKTKANLLFASFTEAHAQNIAGIPDSILQQELEIRKELTQRNTALEQERQKKPTEIDSTKFSVLLSQSFDLENKYQDLQHRLERDYPKYYEIKYQVNPVTIKEIQQELPPKTAVISYMLTRDNMYIFLISKRKLRVVTQSITDSFNVAITNFVRAIKTFDKQAYVTNNAILYSKLIEPVQSEIRSMKKLVIIPSGNLFYVPFEALFNPGNSNSVNRYITSAQYSKLPYLINQHEIAYHLSGSLYLQSLQAPSQNLPASFVGFAPVFDDSIATERSGEPLAMRSADSTRAIIFGGFSYGTLEYSDDEVNSIRDLFHQHHKKADVFLRSEASEKNFKQRIKGYKYIHLATHGFLNKEHPDLSGLLFAVPEGPYYNEDGILYSGEMYNLSTNADLAVLSSCESGIGKLIPGEGVLALTRGFLYSGIPNVIVSLWKIYDKYASELMVDFYSNLLDSEDYSQALRDAKLHLISNPQTAFPQKWSSFILIGR